MGNLEIPAKTPALTKTKKIWFVVFFLLSFTAVLTIGGEIILRWRGVRPWQPIDVSIKVEPGGKLFVKHPTLGYSHLPGEFTVTLGGGYSFRITHLPNSLRITHPLNTYEHARPKEEIWILGCSYTHGWSLNDQDTFPWLLQERFPEFEFVNFGISGYGTIHSLIQLREALAMGRVPKMVVLVYASFHNERNLFLRSRRKIIVPYNKLGPLVQPYAMLGANGKLNYYLIDVEYWEFPLMRYSALSHLIELIYNKLEYHLYHSRRVTEALILEMASIANRHKIDVVVAGITKSEGTRKMLLFARHHGMRVVDISVDNSIKEYNKLPYDGHPSARANKIYADRLEAFLRAESVEGFGNRYPGF